MDFKNKTRKERIRILANSIKDALWEASYDGGRDIEGASVSLATLLVDLVEQMIQDSK